MEATQIIKPLSRTNTATSISQDVDDPEANLGMVSVVASLPANAHAFQSRPTYGQVSTTLSAIDAAWLEFEIELKPWERQLFANNNLTGLQGLQTRLQSDADKQGSESKALRCVKLLRPVIRAVQVYSPLVTTATSAAPIPAAASVLGAIQCFLVVPTNLLDMHENITDDLQFLGLEISRLLGYQRSLFKDDVDMQTILFQVFKDILQYLRETVHLFYDKEGRLKTTKMIGKSTFTNYTQHIGPLKTKILNDLNHFEKEAKLRLDQRDDRFQQMTRYDLDDIRGNLNEMRNDVRGIVAQFIGTSMAHGGGYGGIPSRATLPQSQPAMLTTTPAVNLDSYRLSDDVRSRILNSWLPHVDFELEHRQNSSRLENTSQWILHTASFQTWHTNDKANPILTVRGRAGSGKSFLAASTLDHLNREAQSDETVVVQVYCKAFERGQAGISYVFGSIIRQMLLHEHGRAADGIVEQVYNKHRKSAPSAQELKELAIAVSKKFQKVFVVIDGIDECQRVGAEGFGNLCVALHSFAVSSNPVRLICFCRPHYELFDRLFDQSPSIPVDDGQNESDMRLFIHKTLFENEPLFDRLPELRDEVEAGLLLKAKGVFLWLRCLLPSLQACQSEKEVKEEMNELPSDMTAFYTEQAAKILSGKKKGRKERALKILLWVCNAQRNLSRKEMAELLAVEPNAIDLANDARIEGEGTMTSDCHDLVVYQDEHYQPMHKSLEEWLHQIVDEDYDDLRVLQDRQAQIHQDIAVICLTYLQFEKFRGRNNTSEADLKEFLEANPFYKYAATCWGYHVEQIKSPSKQTQALIQEFLHADDLRNLSMQAVMYCAPVLSEAAWTDPKSTPLHLLAIFGLLNIAKQYLAVSEMITSFDGYDATPLDYAMANRKKEMTHWIIDQAVKSKLPIDQINVRLLPLHSAASAGWADVIEKLYLQHLDLNTQGTKHNTCALHVACLFGSEDAAAALLSADAHLELTNSDGQTPLVVAAECGHGKIVGLLADKGANLNHRGSDGLTALHHAAINNDVVTARKLIQKSADQNIGSGQKSGNLIAMHAAAENNSLQVLSLLLSTKNVDCELDMKWTALMLAARAGNHRVVQMLIDRGATLDHVNVDGGTVFHLAAEYGFEDIIITLHSKDPRLFDLPDNNKETALMKAIRGGHQKLSLTLLDLNASIFPQGDSQSRPLHVAIEMGLTDLAIEILKRCPSEATAAGFNGHNALHYAARFKQSTLVETLLLDYHMDINCINNATVKRTAIHVAATENDVDFMNEILRVSTSYKIEPKVDWSILDSGNQSALHLAATQQASECIKFLLERNVASTFDSSNNTPFHSAVCTGNVECVKLLLPEDIEIRGFNGQTALFKAVLTGHKNVVEYLATNGASLNTCDNRRISAFNMAIETKQPDIAKFLLDRKVHVDTKGIGTSEGWTPLHSSALVGDYEISKCLLERGCSGLSPSRHGQTPFQLAVSSGNVDLVKLFVSAGQNGLHLSSRGGVTCFHEAATTRNPKMIDYLLSLEQPKDLGPSTPTESGMDPMFLAVESGDKDMVKHLCQLGVGVNGPTLAIRRPIHAAAAAGDLPMLSKLLEMGANINAVQYRGNTPLIMATQSYAPLAVFGLLANGADTSIETWFGHGVLDVMSEHPEFWKNFSWIPEDKLAQGLQLKPMKLCSGAIHRLQPLLNSQQAPVDNVLDKRTANLLSAANALLRLSIVYKEHESDALTLLTEVGNLPNAVDALVDWKCCICTQIINWDAKLKCTTCFREICKSCYEACKLNEAGEIVGMPPNKAEWERLEKAISPLRQLVTGPEIKTERIAKACFDYSSKVEGYVDTNLKQYQDLDNAAGESWWKKLAKPGLDFLSLMTRARALLKENDPKQNDQSGQTRDAWAKLDEELRQNLRSYPPSRCVPIFPCAAAHHRYVEIPHLRVDPEDVSQTLLTMAGRVSDQEIERIIHSLQTRLTELSSRPAELSEAVVTKNLANEPIVMGEEHCESDPQSQNGLGSAPQTVSMDKEVETRHHPLTINGTKTSPSESCIDMGDLTKSPDFQRNDPIGDSHREEPSKNKDQTVPPPLEVGEDQDTVPDTQKSDEETQLHSFIVQAITKANYHGKDILDRVTADNCNFLFSMRASFRSLIFNICSKYANTFDNLNDPAAVELVMAVATEESWIGDLAFDMVQVVTLGITVVDLFEPDESVFTIAAAEEAQVDAEIDKVVDEQLQFLATGVPAGASGDAAST